jgi:hypothetical protein
MRRAYGALGISVPNDPMLPGVGRGVRLAGPPSAGPQGAMGQTGAAPSAPGAVRMLGQNASSTPNVNVLLGIPPDQQVGQQPQQNQQQQAQQPTSQSVTNMQKTLFGGHVAPSDPQSAGNVSFFMPRRKNRSTYLIFRSFWLLCSS